MRAYGLRLILSAMVLAAQLGCTAISERSCSMWRALTPNDGYADPTEGPDEAWIREAGDQARQSHPRETATEPTWFRGLTMSDRAREIERNLGVDEN